MDGESWLSGLARLLGFGLNRIEEQPPVEAQPPAPKREIIPLVPSLPGVEPQPVVHIPTPAVPVVQPPAPAGGSPETLSIKQRGNIYETAPAAAVAAPPTNVPVPAIDLKLSRVHVPRQIPRGLFPAKRSYFEHEFSDRNRLDAERYAIEDDFDRFVDAKTNVFYGTSFNARIAGVSFLNADSTPRQALIAGLRPFEALVLEIEPANRFSFSAVKLLNTDGYQLGYVPDSFSSSVKQALESNGVAEAYVRHVRQTDDGVWGAAISLMFRARATLLNEFQYELSHRKDVERWHWARVSGIEKRNTDGTERQAVIAALRRGDILRLRPEGGLSEAERVNLETPAGQIVGSLAKQYSEMVLTGMRIGRDFTAIVFELREVPRWNRHVPAVALVLLRAPDVPKLRTRKKPVVS